MESFIVTLALGIVFAVLGILNLKGNISMLHSYHRHRVTEEDMKPLGKRVGIGMLICGGASFLYGLFSLFYDLTKHLVFVGLGVAVLLVGLAIGIALMLKAIIKYNKGLF